MIIIPQIKKIIITPPRCGSTSIWTAVKEKYPESIRLYRHMEASQIPFGYEDYDVHCIVRKPLERMISIYKFMVLFEGTSHTTEEFIGLIRRESAPGFHNWLMYCNVPIFGSERASIEKKPFYKTSVSMPENRKSQMFYANGAEIVLFDRMEYFFRGIGISELPVINGFIDSVLEEEINKDITDHASDIRWCIKTFHKWDLIKTGKS